MLKVLPLVFILISTLSVQYGCEQSLEEPLHSDLLITDEPFIKCIPDSILSFNLNNSLNSIFQDCLESGIKMPQFNPDSDLTSSMPLIAPQKVDEGIFIPRFKECSEETGTLSME